MNARERFLATMRFQPVDRLPFMPHFGAWAATYAAWRKAGLPERFNVDAAMGVDPKLTVPVYFGFAPAFERVPIGEDEHTVTYRNHEGILLRELKVDPDLSMPQFLEFPVRTREDFEALQPRLRLNFDQRFPKDWAGWCEAWRFRSAPLQMNADRQGGFFGPLRNLMGLENLLFAYFDDPALVERMIENRTELMLAILGRILKDTTIDWFCFWEDMCYNHGPLLSPALFRKHMVPAYRKVTDFLRANGVDAIFVDSDGNVAELLPLWIEAGVNGVYPLEVQSGMDVVKLRAEYGRDLLMIGGVNKRVLTQGPAEIDREIRRVSAIFDKGGYIPQLDHSVPPNVPVGNFLYYLSAMGKAVGI
jgi:uroporphyrinogen decarboxylase